MVGWKKGKTHYTNKKITNQRDVFTLELVEFEDLLDVWYNKRDSMSEYVHPTQKPVALAQRAINKSSKEGEIVLDVFGGSGSTLIACEQKKRICYTMELDPYYCSVIIERWENLTGKKAVKISN